MENVASSQNVVTSSDSTSLTLPEQSQSETTTLVGAPGKDPSEIAMSAIQTTLAISGWTIGVLGLVIAIIAIFGWGAIRGSAKKNVERIANKSWSDYINSEKFKELVKSGIDESVALRWQDDVVAKTLTEEQREPGDQELFQKGGEA